MAQTDKTRTAPGLSLGKPGIILPETGFFSSFCFYAVLLSIAGAGSMGCFFTAFGIAPDLLPVLAMGFSCALLCSAQFLLNRRRKLVIFALLVIWGILLWWNWGDFAQGFFQTGNIVITAYREKLNYTIPLFPAVFAAPIRKQYLLTVFAVLIQFPFFWLLSWLFLWLKSSLGAFCLTGLLLLLPLCFSIVPAPWALGLLLLFWIFLLFSAPSFRQRRRLAKEGGRYQVSGEPFLRPSSLLLLPMIALCLLAVYKANPPETYERPEIANEIRSGFTENVNLPAIIRGGTGSGGNRVDLSTLGKRSYTGKTALRVKHYWQGGAPDEKLSATGQKDYLKSFVGSVYTGTSWEHLSEQDAAGVNSMMQDQKAQTLPADFSQNLVSPWDARASYILSVQKINVDSRSIYSPYGLYAPSGLSEGMAYLDDGYIKSSRLFSGGREYSLSAVAVPKKAMFYGPRFAEGFGNAVLTSGDEESAEAVSRLQEEQQEEWSDFFSSAMDLWDSPAWVDDYFSESSQDFIESVEAYNDFVYEHYTQLPEELRDFLLEFSEENGLTVTETFTLTSDMAIEIGSEIQSITFSPFAFDREMIIRQVRQLLAQRCTYSLDPPALPAGKDFVRYFLEDSREGFCVHFASAAVALFRAAGIPARYAEGYAVPVGDDGEWVDVPDYNAHAWVEVYWGGLGWVPVEVTPPSAEAPAACANAITPSQAEIAPTPTPTPTPSPSPAAPTPSPESSQPEVSHAPTPAAGTPTPSGGAQGDGKKEGSFPLLGLLGAFLLLLALTLPFALVWASRRFRLRRRERMLCQRDRNKAAVYAYAHLLRLYAELRDQSEPSPPKEIEELVQKARFSNHTLTPEELGRITGLAKELEHRLDKELSTPARLRCKYLLALF